MHHNGPDPIPAAGAQAEKEAAYCKELMVVQSASQIVNLMGYNILASDPAEIDLNDVAPVQQLRAYCGNKRAGNGTDEGSPGPVLTKLRT